jgi:hypothetical protein
MGLEGLAMAALRYRTTSAQRLLFVFQQSEAGKFLNLRSKPANAMRFILY